MIFFNNHILSFVKKIVNTFCEFFSHYFLLLFFTIRYIILLNYFTRKDLYYV
nr:MAG TPA: hypothetical protein [Caudoviricetes sp.]